MIDTVRIETSGTSSSVAHGLSEREFHAYDSIPAEVDYVYYPSFSLPGAEEKFFGEDAPHVPVPSYTLMPVFEDPDAAPVRSRASLSAKQEKTLFLRYNYARFRLARLQQPQRARFSAPRARRMAAWQERVLSLRAALARANLPLVHAMTKRVRITSVEFGELISEGNLAVLRCIDKFDVGLGF